MRVIKGKEFYKMVKQQHKMKAKGIQHINNNNYAGDSINEHRAIESGNSRKRNQATK